MPLAASDNRERSMSSPRVCVVGSCNVDLTFRTPRLPRPGETLTASSYRTTFGGKGANQAVMAARLSNAVTLVGCVGQDPFGDQIISHHRSEGIDVQHIRRDAEQPTGTAAIFVDDAARNVIVVVPGANGALMPNDART